MAMWQIVNYKNGIISYEVHRAVGITQKCAWFLDRRIRFALGMTPSNKLSGQVETDETFIGGEAGNMHKDKRAEKITGTGGKDMTIVMGILERGSKSTGSTVRVKVVDNRNKKTLQSECREHVLAGSALLTDAPSPTKAWTNFSIKWLTMQWNTFAAKSTPTASKTSGL